MIQKECSSVHLAEIWFELSEFSTTINLIKNNSTQFVFQLQVWKSEMLFVIPYFDKA